ncbi:MAG: shikimate kinase [Propionibacteriales bacterium]|nr:shikimate kinase [Propionibacteriales bacterium]
MSPARLVLIGMPASGKSSVGALVADAWGLPLLDTDLVVAERLGGTVTELLADPAAESAFRDAEVGVCLDALDRDAVVALGSGALASDAVRGALVGLPVVWLQTSVVTATRRLGLARFGMDVLAAIRTTLDAQLAERAGWYAQAASSVIDTDRIGVHAVADHILASGEGS